MSVNPKQFLHQVFRDAMGDIFIILQDGTEQQIQMAAPGLLDFAVKVAYNAPGLTAGIPIPGYTPTAGDLITTALIMPTTPWNGTTPLGDFYVGSVATVGLFAGDDSDPQPMDSPITASPGTNTNGFYPIHYLDGISWISGGSYGAGSVTATSDNLLFVVSQDGTKGGADPGATRGEAILRITVLRAADLVVGI